jgi:hypothetical protein
MDPKDIGWEDMDWIHQAHNRNQWRTLVKTIDVKGGEFDYLSNYLLLKKDSATWS